jgi:hypothetical protein
MTNLLIQEKNIQNLKEEFKLSLNYDDVFLKIIYSFDHHEEPDSVGGLMVDNIFFQFVPHFYSITISLLQNYIDIAFNLFCSCILLCI